MQQCKLTFSSQYSLKINLRSSLFTSLTVLNEIKMKFRVSLKTLVSIATKRATPTTNLEVVKQLQANAVKLLLIGKNVQ